MLCSGLRSDVSVLTMGADAGRGHRGHFCCCTGLALSWHQRVCSWTAQHSEHWRSSELAGLGFIPQMHGQLCREQDRSERGVWCSAQQVTLLHVCSSLLRIASAGDPVSQNLSWKLSSGHPKKGSAAVAPSSGYHAVVLRVNAETGGVKWKPLRHVRIGTFAFRVSACALAAVV